VGLRSNAKIDLLRRVPLFEHCAKKELALIATLDIAPYFLTVMNFRRAAVVPRHTEPANWLDRNGAVFVRRTIESLDDTDVSQSFEPSRLGPDCRSS